ncbi:hypothetical protein PY650_25905 [Rhizobium calliandrae]|uniref:Uncharacterized protein n=1 Tax=Rhizobium calliandrae TaxID=1312182 RepID=A0ABT7KP15_9HYPH|nr:hypothetical protein [Rhizobium calliandrae]MDL2409009.1 hypothetical protein [Rhizobium calliandrae]
MTKASFPSSRETPLTKVELEAPRDGYVNGAIGQRPIQTDAVAIYSIVSLKKRRKADAVIRSGLDVVTKDYISEFPK